MRILFVHNTYQRRGGEDVAVERECALLRDHGHEAVTATVSNSAITGLYGAVQTAIRAPHSRWGASWMRHAIDQFSPEVVHVHNFFPLLSPSIYDVCAERGLPVVQTLHNYRLLCANALLLRGGRPCEDCVTGDPYQAVLHACYRRSRAGSWAVARMIRLNRRSGTWIKKVDRYVALTEFAKSRFVLGGVPAERIVVKPHFVPDPGQVARHPGDTIRALYVGRLSAEKGIETLVHAWASLEYDLTIVGDGPLDSFIRGAQSERVHMLGQADRSTVLEQMRSAAFLIVPSTCYENFPLVIAEAFAVGLPVIASNLGAMAELVEDGTTGVLFRAGDAADLAAKVRWAAANPERLRAMGRRARERYEERFTPDRNYAALIEIYEAAARRGVA